MLLYLFKKIQYHKQGHPYLSPRRHEFIRYITNHVSIYFIHSGRSLGNIYKAFALHFIEVCRHYYL